VCAEVSLACLALHKQVLQDLQQAKQGQLKPVLLSELLVPRAHDDRHADGEQPGAGLQEEAQGYNCDGSAAAASSMGRSPSTCSGLHSAGQCMSAAAGDVSSTEGVPEDRTAQQEAACDAKAAPWDNRDAASDTQWVPWQDQVDLRPTSAGQQQDADGTQFSWLADLQQQRHQHQQPGLTLSFQPQQLAMARSPDGSSGTASPLYRQDGAVGPQSKQLPYDASPDVDHGRCGSADWEAAYSRRTAADQVSTQQHAAAAAAQPGATGRCSGKAAAGQQIPCDKQLLTGPHRPYSSSSMRRHGSRPEVGDWIDDSMLGVGEQLQPACRDTLSTPAATLQLFRPGQELPARTAPDRQLKALSSLPARLQPGSSNGSTKQVLRRCVSGADADADAGVASVAHTAAVLRNTASTRRQLESSWRQGLAKAAGKASAAHASLDELRAVDALDARVKGGSSRRASLAVGSMGRGSESDGIPRRQLQSRSSAGSARHSQPKPWSDLAREPVLQPGSTRGSVAWPHHSTHTLQAAAVVVGRPKGSGGWPARKAGALSLSKSTTGRPVASSALDLLD
jgi:hypothetical protein